MKIRAIGIVGQKAVKIASEGKFWASRHASEVLLVAGTAAFAGTMVAVAKGALKAREVREEYENNKKDIEEAAALNDPEYTAEEVRKDKVVAVCIAVKGYAKCYIPSVIFATLSLGCFFGEHHILKRRNLALAAAYSVLNDGFKSYRSRVVEKYGEEEDYILANGLRVEKETVTEIGEDGKKHKKKEERLVKDSDISPYSFIFDDSTSMGKVTNVAIARDDLMAAQVYADTILKTRGYILLNEVLRGLKMHETSDGAVVGWQLKGNGDGFVDFRMKQIFKPEDPEYVGFNLDFNVDGLIYQDIDRYTGR